MGLKVFAVLALCLAMTAQGLAATTVDMQFIRAIAHKVTVLHKGQIAAEGDVGEIETNRLVRDIYLGKR